MCFLASDAGSELNFELGSGDADGLWATDVSPLSGRISSLYETSTGVFLHRNLSSLLPITTIKGLSAVCLPAPTSASETLPAEVRVINLPDMNRT